MSNEVLIKLKVRIEIVIYIQSFFKPSIVKKK